MLPGQDSYGWETECIRKLKMIKVFDRKKPFSKLLLHKGKGGSKSEHTVDSARSENTKRDERLG